MMEKTGLQALRKASHHGQRCWGWSPRVMQAVFWAVVAGWAVAMTPDAAWPSAIKEASAVAGFRTAGNVVLGARASHQWVGAVVCADQPPPRAPEAGRVFCWAELEAGPFVF